MTIDDYRAYFSQTLQEHYPPEEVQSLCAITLEYVLKMNRVEVSLSRKQTLSQEQITALEAVLSRLATHEPIQYITGTTEFYGMEFQVNPATLIPRPETEELVAWILEELQTTNDEGRVANNRLSVIDIGTGSGCIAISLAKNLPDATVEAIDISLQALETATANARNNETKVTFFQKDILEAEGLPKQYDIIVSNPPYVRELEKVEINDNVLKHEPHSALFVEDQDPLLFYRKIAELAVNNLTPGGQLFFEINQYLGKETVTLVEELGFTQVELRKDMFGEHRMIRATK